jgi:hypothetical protein
MSVAEVELTFAGAYSSSEDYSALKTWILANINGSKEPITFSPGSIIASFSQDVTRPASSPAPSLSDLSAAIQAEVAAAPAPPDNFARPSTTVRSVGLAADVSRANSNVEQKDVADGGGMPTYQFALIAVVGVAVIGVVIAFAMKPTKKSDASGSSVADVELGPPAQI